MKTLALIMAAGSGERLGSDTPKAYVNLAGKNLLRRSMETFLSHPGVDGVRVVIDRAHHPLYRKTAQGLTLFPCVIGGKSRQDSVRLGLKSVARAEPDYVLIHDAARPLVTHAVISRVLDSLKKHQAAYPALPVADTLRRGAEPIAREGLLAAQTPQGFHFDDILAAHRARANMRVTDDIALAEAAGLAVGVVEGERCNFKVTTQGDLDLMQQLASSPFETRVGMGLDVHHFVPHDGPQHNITLCGIKVPHDKRLHGHSDADAGLHALVDAILGAIGEGDIGQHFPPDDPQWAGADSSRFLIHAFQLLKAKGGEIVNIDITIIGEKPRISPFRAQMVSQVAGLLKLSNDRVNIKATTTEKLGFLGRGEGLAAQAVVSIKVPA